MEYTVETTIQKPLQEVLEQYHQSSNYMKWMPGIKSYKNTKGTQREEGSKSVYEFTMNGRDFTIEETIIKNEGTAIIAKYVSNGTLNTQTTKFIPIDENTTRYKVQESFELKGFMKLIGFLMPSSFKKQTKEFVEAFRYFAVNK